MVSAAATDISTSCAVETDSVGVGALVCVGAQYQTICFFNITYFILSPPPPPEGFYFPQTAISGFLFVFYLLLFSA